MSSLEELLSDLLSGDEFRAEGAVAALVSRGEGALPALRELTLAANPDHRWWGLRVLAGSPHTQPEWLIPFLSDPAPEVRQCAALGLASRPDEAAVEPLAGALSDTDGMVASLAGKALARQGKVAVPALIEVVKDAPQAARIRALRALAEIRDHRAIPIMMKVMEEESVLLQHWAKEGLDRLGLDMVYIRPV